MIYPAKWFTSDINYIAGSNMPFILEVLCNAAAYSMTGSQIDIIISDNSGVIQTLSTAGGSPLITIANSELTISPTAFTNKGKYKFYMRQTVGTTIIPIMKGNWLISAA